MPSRRGRSTPAEAEREPLWSRLRASLVAQMEGGDLPPGAQLPSEHELCLLYGVSRTVVRQTLAQLVAERRIYKVQGSGAFVAPEKAADDFIGTNVGLSGEMIARGLRVTNRVIESGIGPALRREAARLGIAEGAPVFRVLRTQAVDDVVRGLTRTVLNAALVPGIERVNLVNQSLYNVMRHRYGLVPVRAERWIEAVLPDAGQARLLGVRRNTPVLAIESIACDAAGRPIEFYDSLYRSDTSRLHIVIR
jgi:GntR family transcriptional regulator